MKVRDSGMPERDYWETLFNVPVILDALRVDRSVNSAIEVGSGYGTFTVPVAKRISGTLHAFDIEPTMIAETEARVKEAGLQNVKLSFRDVIADGFSLAAGTFDAVLLFNILHGENPIELLRISAQLLSPNGRLLVIHWRSDIATPRGPDLSIRPRPEQILLWANQTALLDGRTEPVLLPPWHFGLVLQRREVGRQSS
jgi:SAM-dependent methyltransferase